MKDYISFEEFISYIGEHIIEDCESEVTVKIKKITKMNGRVYTGLVLKDEKAESAPICYLEDFYQMYRNGMSLEECLIYLREFYSYAEEITRGMKVDNMRVFSYVKGKIVYRLVNYEKNKKILEKCPHIQLHDLAIVFYCIVKKLDAGFSTMLVTKEEVALWETDIHELLLLARENTRRIFPATFILMSEFLEESLEVTMTEEEYHQELYILTNEHLTNGAAVILYDGVLRAISEKIGCDFYLLPSSIHEMLVVPDHGNIYYENLKTIVYEANRSVVSEEDYLSDSVYYYDGKENKIICCCT